MTALVIRGGHLVDPGAGVDALKDILLKDGRVAEIAGPGKLKSSNGAEVLDAGGLTVARRDWSISMFTCASLDRVTRKPLPQVRRQLPLEVLRLWPQCQIRSQ